MTSADRPPASPFLNSRKGWAVITGASSGIGQALAVELAQNGYSLVLVARNEAALHQLAKDLHQRFGVLVKVLPKDLSRPASAQEIFEILQREGVQVEILVNNAGFGLHGLFLETDPRKEEEMIHLHVISALHLIKCFLPAMVSRRTGRILNVASVYAFSAVPCQSVYSATKAFLLTFSEALRSELAGTGVRITVLLPGITRTEFRRRMGKSESKIAKGMDPQRVAACGIAALMKGKFLAIPGWGNWLYIAIARLTPSFLMTRLIGWINHLRGLQGETPR